MNDLSKVTDCSLWVMLSDVAEIMSKHADENNEVSLYWYLLYQDVQKELDSRIINGGNENE